MVRKLLALIAILIPLILVACGGDDETTTAASSDTTASESTTEASTTESGGGETVAIKETDFALDPSDATVKAGSVTFDVANDGGTVHNLEIEGDGVEEVTDDLEPGDSGQLTVDLAAGTYEMYCAIGNHRELGMDGTVTVE